MNEYKIINFAYAMLGFAGLKDVLSVNANTQNSRSYGPVGSNGKPRGLIRQQVKARRQHDSRRTK